MQNGRLTRIAQGIQATLKGLTFQGSPEVTKDEFFEILFAPGNERILRGIMTQELFKRGGGMPEVERFQNLLESVSDPRDLRWDFGNAFNSAYERYLEGKIELDPEYRWGQLPAQKRKVFESAKTKEKLEKWFSKRGIPIEIRGYEWAEDFFESRKDRGGTPGQITYHLFTAFDDPPTPWMITHNLSHALFDYPWDDNPWGQIDFSEEEREVLSGRISRGDEILQSLDQNGRKITTRARNKLTTDRERLHEMFAQWVVTGAVVLDPPHPPLERDIEILFHREVNEAARKGEVISAHDFTGF